MVTKKTVIRILFSGPLVLILVALLTPTSFLKQRALSRVITIEPSSRVQLTIEIVAAAGVPLPPAAGNITTFAGTGGAGSGGDGGPATAAQLTIPEGMAVDAAGNLYIAEFFGHRVRKVDPFGTITTLAGTGTEGFSGDGGPATAAKLSRPFAVAIDTAGNVYIAEVNNHRVRKVNPAGTISTFAGNGLSGFGGDGGPATAASMSATGVAVDTAGNVYIADQSNNRIRKVNPSGIITTFAGTGVRGSSGDGGPATAAMLSIPPSVSVDAGATFIFLSRVQVACAELTLPGSSRPLQEPELMASAVMVVPQLLLN
jgi:hypothetical protein